MAEQDVTAEIAELRQKFAEKYKDAIDGGEYDQRDLDRLRDSDLYAKCIVTTSGGMEKAVERVDTVFKFRKTYNIHDMTEDSLNPELRTRDPLYYHGVDKEGRKVLLFKIIKHKKGTLVEEAKRYIAYRLEQHHLEHPGDRIILIFDFTDAGLTNMDLDVTKFIITCLSTYFPAILGKILMFEMPFLMSAIWKIIKGWLDQEQRDKIIFVKKADIQKYINVDQLEDHMIKK